MTEPRLSEKRAELAANGLLAQARAQRERNAERGSRWLTWFYPQLKRLPPSLRRTAYARARFHSYHLRQRQKYVWFVIAAIVLIVYLVGTHFDQALGRGAGSALAAGLAITFAVSRVLWHEFLLRRWLRHCDPRVLAAERELG